MKKRFPHIRPILCLTVFWAAILSTEGLTASSPHKSPEETIRFYQAHEMRAEFTPAEDKLLMVFQTTTESLYYCPGVIVERLDPERVSVKFIRWPVKSDGPKIEFQPAGLVKDWRQNNPDDQTFKTNTLAQNPLAQFIVLPPGLQDVIIYENLQPTDIPTAAPK